MSNESLERDGLISITAVLIIGLVVLGGLLIYAVIDNNDQGSKCESIGGNYEYWGRTVCIKFIDGQYREGYVIEINGDLKFVIGSP